MDICCNVNIFCDMDIHCDNGRYYLLSIFYTLHLDYYTLPGGISQSENGGFVAVIRNRSWNTDDDAGAQTGSPARPSLGRNDRISYEENMTVFAHSSQSKSVCVRNVICAVQNRLFLISPI